MRNLLKLIVTIFFVISVVTIGIFISRVLFYLVETRGFNIPFFEILKISIRAGLAGGFVGGIGIYLIPYFSTKRSK